MSDVLNNDTDLEYFSLSSSNELFSSAESDISDMPSLTDNLDITFATLHKNFNVVHINAQSLPAHYMDLLSTFKCKNIHAILISESFLKPSLPSTLYPLPGFRLLRNDRTYLVSNNSSSRMVGGGGVAIYLRGDIECNIISHSQSIAQTPEHLFLEVSLHHTKILLGVYYSPSLHVNFFNSLEALLTDFCPRFEHFILMGDFNTCIIKNDHRSNKFLSLLQSFDLHCLPLGPTHYPHNGPPSRLDHIITSSPEMCSLYGQFNATAFSAHDLVFASYKLRPPKRKYRVMMLRNYKTVDVVSLRNDVAGADWVAVEAAADIDSKVEVFNSILLTIYDKHAPLRPVRVRHLPAPWLTDDLKKIMALRDRAKIRLRHHPSEVERDRYVQVRNKCSKLCRAARRKYVHSGIENCPPNKLWKFLKGLGVGKQQHTIGRNLDLNAINKHFSTSPIYYDPATKQSTLAQIAGSCSVCSDADLFELGAILSQEVIDILNSIKSKAVGNDNISLDMLDPIKDLIAHILAVIINFSLSTGTFPTSWKLAHVIPLPKKSNPSTFSEYRPISILPVLSKVLEHFVHRRLTKYLYRNDLLSQYQSGFRTGHSTVTALVKITEDIRLNIDKKNILILVLLDFTSAFNTVDFDVLLGILSKFRFSSLALAWFRSYLSGRRQLVRVDDCCSDWCAINAGVPQGGVLSPVLFSIFINGITSALLSSFHLYADDMQLYTAAPIYNLTNAVDVINNDLNVIAKWTKDFGLLVNADKSQAVIMGSSHFIAKLRYLTVPNVIYDGKIIPYSTTVKNLGIVIDQTLSWGPHIGEVSRKIHASLHSLKRLQNFLPLGTRLLLAQSLLLPLLDYADVAYLDPTQELVDKLERLQNQCIRYIYNLRKYDHISSYRSQLKWLPIRLRRNVHILTLLFNILFNPTCPHYLQERFKFREIDVRLRCSNDFIIDLPCFNTQSYAMSFTVHAARLWNSLPNNLKMAQSLKSFKAGIIKFYFENPSSLSQL